MITFTITAEQEAKIRKTFFEQGKIYAIKECREITEWSLKDAKEAIEKWCWDLLKKEPNCGIPYDFQFGAAQNGTHCAELILQSGILQCCTLRIGDFTVDINSGDKIDFNSKEGSFRFTAEELRAVLKFYDATRMSRISVST